MNGKRIRDGVSLRQEKVYRKSLPSCRTERIRRKARPLSVGARIKTDTVSSDGYSSVIRNAYDSMLY